MAVRRIKRRAHTRRLRNGFITRVRETYVHIVSSPGENREAFHHKCACGTDVISVPMPNGGWVHFEAAKGLTKVKHPCFYLGAKLSRKRDENTPDLFDVIKDD